MLKEKFMPFFMVMCLHDVVVVVAVDDDDGAIYITFSMLVLLFFRYTCSLRLFFVFEENMQFHLWQSMTLYKKKVTTSLSRGYLYKL